MIVEHVQPWMVKQAQDGYSAWDRIIQNNWLESENEEERNAAAQLLENPAIYLYAFMKWNDEPMKAYSYQYVILNDSHKRIIFSAANQIGKSVCLCMLALHFALMNPGKTVLMISRTLPQSKDLLRQIKFFLHNSVLEYRFDIGDSETKTEIYFKHFDIVTGPDGKEHEIELAQSRIICVPATEAALGYAADLLLIDELAFFDDGENFYYQIAQPRTYSTKGQIIVFSNPNGQQGIFWKLWNDLDFHKYRFNFLDKPGNTIEEYERLRKKLNREKFESTVDAVFTSAEGAFLTYDERKRIQHERPNYIPAVLTQPVYVFFDWAKSMDRTVRVIGYPIGDDYESMSVHVLEMKEYPSKTSYAEIVDDLHSLILQLGQEKIFMVGWDNTGVGRGIEDFINRIQALGIMCNPVEFNLENKSRIYIGFKFLVERNRIDIPFVDECDNQLSRLVFKKTSRGHWQVHHLNESDRDDFPDAIAGLCSLIIQPENVPVTCTIIGGGLDNYEPPNFVPGLNGFIGV